jgi:hypothetical protein
MLLRVACVLLCGASLSCSDSSEGVRTQFIGSYTFTASERRAIARIAGDAAIEARRHLPALPVQLTLQVRSGKDVIPEIGATASALPPDWVVWTVDPDHTRGVLAIAESELRATLFHEFHHLVRFVTNSPETLMDRAIGEGLATAFERDFAGVARPWAKYPDEVAAWVEELQTLPPSAKRDEWMIKHPDGRRWIGMRAGTYLVDVAMQKTNRTSASLVALPTSEIIAAAQH